MEYISSLVEESRNQIKKYRKNKLFKLVKEVEFMLTKLQLPILEYYEDDTYYTLLVYPDNMAEANMEIRKSLIDIGNELGIDKNMIVFKPYIYGYITNVFYDNYKIITIYNMFYPKNNYKYHIKTYHGQSRFGNSSILYSHVKYSLEEICASLYNPADFEDYSEHLLVRHDIIQQWKKINPEISKIVQKNLKKKGKLGNQMIHEIKKYIIISNYDPTIAICIANINDRKKIESILSAKFKLSDKIENFAKTAHDPRLVNYTYKVNNNPELRIWYSLNFELVPTLPHNPLHAHIHVCQRLALSEYLAYELMNVTGVANLKLFLFFSLLKKEKIMREKKVFIEIENCNFHGINYPLLDFLNEVRIQKIIEFKEKNSN